MKPSVTENAEEEDFRVRIKMIKDYTFYISI